MCTTCILKELRNLRKGQRKLMSAISDFAATAMAALTTANNGITSLVGSLTNISGDQQNLLQQIKDLQAQLLNGALSDADKAAIQGVVDLATTVAANATSAAGQGQQIADSVPDLPAPPPPAG